MNCNEITYIIITYNHFILLRERYSITKKNRYIKYFWELTRIYFEENFQSRIHIVRMCTNILNCFSFTYNEISCLFKYKINYYKIIYFNFKIIKYIN